MEYVSAPTNFRIPNRVDAAIGGVTLTGGRLQTLWKNNIAFLKRFDLDRMLYWFRVYAGKDAPGAPYGYDGGHFENNLYGQTAGEFLMSAGTALLWEEDAELRAMLNAVVDGIAECADEDGYLIPIAKKHFNEKEYPNYVRAWLIFGLLAAGAAGNDKAYKLARGMGDWFNRCNCLPYVKDLNLGFQGILANTELFRSPVGVPEDLEVAQTYYREDWWLEQLIEKDQRAIYQHPGNHPHSTLLTTLEAILDMYRITGEEFLMDAVRSALKMYEEKWQHVGGGIVMCEFDAHYPGCNFLDRRHNYNELCSTAFWVQLNQRMLLLDPDNAHYADEIENSVYNMLTAAQVEDRGLHYLGFLDGCKDTRWVDIATCCAATGSRLISIVPQLLYTHRGSDIYVHLYADSTARLGGTTLRTETELPYGGRVRLTVAESDAPVTLHIRIPRWCSAPVTIGGVMAQPGTYLVLKDVAAGTVLDFTFPFTYRATRYTGAEEIPGKDRYAFEYGPLLLAAMGRGGVTVTMDPAHPEQWLARKTANRFTLRGNNHQEFRAYMDITDEPLTVYPVVERPQDNG